MAFIDGSQILEELGAIREGIKNLNEKLDKLDQYGCAHGRDTDRKLDEHRTQHKTAYVIFGIVAGIAGWLASYVMR